MKTKAFLLVCLLLGIGLTQLSAQNGKGGSGTFKQELSFTGWSLNVYCDGVVSDVVTCPVLKVEITVHYVNGVEVWGSNKVKNLVVTSVKTGEEYKSPIGFDHWSFIKGYVVSEFHLIGNKGHHISMKIITDTNTWEIVDISSNCR
ncbi:MAG TPA: hypothetical protein DCR40_02690 [Prolixibacteraceae bacterium]|nr:hypothetical protein [Prolixibacteraceae bacterium]